MKKYHTILFTIFSAILFLQQTPFVLALETVYPDLGPATPTITPESSLPQYIQYFVYFAIAAAGIIGVISIVIAGARILFYNGNPTSVGEAKDRIVGTISGIALLLFSFILLTTINPDLINPRTTISQLTPGIYLMGDNPGGIDDQHPDGKIYEPLGDDGYVADTTTLDPVFKKLFYYCPTNTNGANLLVWLYNRKNWEIDRGVNGDGTKVDTISIKCGEIDPAKNPIDLDQVLSLSVDYEDPGVYFYLNGSCSGISSCFNSASCAQKSDGDIPNFDSRDYELGGTVKSMRIVSGQSEQTRYGVILNKDYGLNGECSPPIINESPGSKCYDLSGADPYSTYVIKSNPNPESSGIGVYLRSSNYKTTFLPADEIGRWYTYNADENHNIAGDGNPDRLVAQGVLQGNPREPEECLRGPSDPVPGYPDAKACLSGIKTNGNYNIVIYTRDEETVERTCDIWKGYWNFQDGEYPFDNDKKPYRLDIVPFP